MIEKPNYCIDELEVKFGFTKHDVTFLLKKGILHPFIELSDFTFIAGHNTKDGFTGHATGRLSGKVFLLEKHAHDVITKGKVSTNLFWLKGKQDIYTWSSKEPLDINNVKRDVVSWSSAAIESMKWPILIKKGIRTEPNFLKQMLKTIANNSSDVADEVREKEQRLEKFNDHTSSCPAITIRSEDVLVSSENIKFIQSKMTNDNHVKSNAFLALVEHLIKMYPTKGGAALYKTLIEEFYNENDDIDPKAILIEANERNIVYRSFNGQEKEITKKRFSNLVSEIKNKK